MNGMNYILNKEFFHSKCIFNAMSCTRKKKIKIDFTFSIFSDNNFDVLLIQNSILNNEATRTIIRRFWALSSIFI